MAIKGVKLGTRQIPKATWGWHRHREVNTYALGLASFIGKIDSISHNTAVQDGGNAVFIIKWRLMVQSPFYKISVQLVTYYYIIYRLYIFFSHQTAATLKALKSCFTVCCFATTAAANHFILTLHTRR
jgi:hypothetical protein